MRSLVLMALTSLVVAVVQVDVHADRRAAAHDEYAVELWGFLNQEALPYTSWATSADKVDLPCGPAIGDTDKTYLNRTAAYSTDGLPTGSTVVTEHYCAEGTELFGVTAWVKVSDGYDAGNGDWYWVHYAPTGDVVKTSVDRDGLAKPGFAAIESDGRVWVFHLPSKNLADKFINGEPAKSVTIPAAGPRGLSLRAVEKDTIVDYLAAKEGFQSKMIDDRLWVYSDTDEEAAAVFGGEEPAKNATIPAAGPLGISLRSTDLDTIVAYIAAKPGFAVRNVEGVLWVFKSGTPELADFDAGNEPAKNATIPAAGPCGMSLRSTELNTIVDYLVAQPGFKTAVVDGRLWVFTPGSAAWNEFSKDGTEPGKHVILVGAGPRGMTVKSPDQEIVDAYLRAATPAS